MSLNGLKPKPIPSLRKAINSDFEIGIGWRDISWLLEANLQTYPKCMSDGYFCLTR